MNPYDTIGVKPDASQKDVRAAYRKAASKAHPDKGGSTDAMVAVNKAYELLISPERRANFDATGQSETLSIEVEASQVLAGVFGEVIDLDGDIVREVEKRLQHACSGMTVAGMKMAQDVNRLTKRRSKVKVKAGENLVHKIIDQKLHHISLQQALMERSMKIMKLAQQMLSEYECEVEPRQIPLGSFARYQIFAA